MRKKEKEREGGRRRGEDKEEEREGGGRKEEEGEEEGAGRKWGGVEKEGLEIQRDVPVRGPEVRGHLRAGLTTVGVGGYTRATWTRSKPF